MRAASASQRRWRYLAAAARYERAMSDSQALVVRAIDRTRSNAATQFGIGAVATASFVIWHASLTLTIVFVAVNTLVMFMLGRRWWRLRRNGPAVKALLEQPEVVGTVSAWPRKLPPNRLPLMLDVFTHTGHECSLLLDNKKPQETTALVDALSTRSPDAIIDVPAVPQATLRTT